VAEPASGQDRAAGGETAEQDPVVGAEEAGVAGLGAPHAQNRPPGRGIGSILALILAFLLVAAGVAALLYPYTGTDAAQVNDPFTGEPVVVDLDCAPPVYELLAPEERDMLERREGEEDPCAEGARQRAALGGVLIAVAVVLAVVAERTGRRSREARDARWLAKGA
jgi:hypothetical protein